MVVSFDNGDNKKIVVSIDFASDKEPKKNYKYQQYMNGYNEGYYNIVVTQYSPDDFLKYLEGCEIVYDKKKMNGRYQVGSGRIVTFTHDTPFIDNRIPRTSKIVKKQSSDREETISTEELHDLMGENEKLKNRIRYFNEIALCAMKSSLRSDEICFADEIKSVLLPTKSDFITK